MTTTLPSIKKPKDKASTLTRVKNTGLYGLGAAGNAITGATLLAGAGKMLKPNGVQLGNRSYDFERLASAKNLAKAGAAGIVVGGGLALRRHLKNRQK